MPTADLPSRVLDDGQSGERDAAIDTAINAVIQRRYDAARVAANRALAIDPRAARPRAVLGMVLLQEARLQDPPDLHGLNRGESEILTAEELAPDDAFVGWMRAVFLAETGHMSAAAVAAESALGRTGAAPLSERAALLGVAGTYRYELGEDRAALPHLQSYVGLRPDDAAASFRLASCHLRISQLVIGPNGPRDARRHADAAAAAFERCYALAPGDVDAGLSIGKALMRGAELAGDRGDAVEQQRLAALAQERFRAVAERFADDAEPWFCVGVAAEAAAQSEVAQQAYQDALSRDGEHVPSLLNLTALHLAHATPDREALLALLRRTLTAASQQRSLSRRERDQVTAKLAELEQGDRQD